MRAAARSLLLLVASSVPWLPACLGSGDDASVPGPPEGGGADGSHAGGATDARSSDAGADATVTTLVEGGDDEPSEAALGPEAAGGAAGDAATVALKTTSTLAGIRVANWSPDAPPVDFCIAPHGTQQFVGPVMAALAAPDAGTIGLEFPQVSRYSLVPAAAPKYDVRIIVAGRGVDCSLGGVTGGDIQVPPDPPVAKPDASSPDATPDGSPMLFSAGSTWTVALVGEVQSPPNSETVLKTVTLSDDFVLPPDDAGIVPVAVRLIHAAPGLGHIGLGHRMDSVGKNGWSLGDVPFGNANALINGNGYLFVSPDAVTNAIVDLRLTIQKPDAPDLLPPATLSAAAGSILTLVLAGTSPAKRGLLQLLECVDNAGATDGYSVCRTESDSTCGDGVRDLPYEDCDCGDGLPGHTTTDPQCTDLLGASTTNGIDAVGNKHFCSLSCRVNNKLPAN